ncbi:hypothetical protein ACFVUS_40535 [Nocardia sp. NPDC058058]|uniref:hypothetical protein n=1 Tax=Nocardia sp. NPDC058058 TaxID=3346317 RepID=UPI0036DA938D
MTAETAAAEPVGDTTIEVAAAPRRGKRWILLIVALLGGSAVLALAVFARVHVSPEDAARADLRTAQLDLINAPGAHYTGVLNGPGGKSASVDLYVTNVGDMSGTLEIAPGRKLNYLRIGTKTFVQGSRDAWLTYGFTEDGATTADGQQLEQLSTFYGMDLSVTLTPDSLGMFLGSAAEYGQPVQLGRAISIDGHDSTPITSGTVTTYVHAGRVDRIVHASFDIRVAVMTSDEVSRFCTDLRPTVSALDVASQKDTKVTSVGSWDMSCAPTCAAIATLTSSARGLLDVTIPGITPRSTTPVDNIFNDSVIPRPDCTGVVEMPGNGSTTLTCSFIPNSGGQVASRLIIRPILGRALADALVVSLTDDAARALAKSACRVTRIGRSSTTAESGC